MSFVIRNGLLLVAVFSIFAVKAGAGFIGDTISVRQDTTISSNPSAEAVVASPGVEFDDFGFGSSFDIDVEDPSIEIITTTAFSFASNGFQGLRFSSLDGGSAIIGFSLDVSGNLESFFGPDRVTFGPDRVDVNFDYTPGGYAPGDRVTIRLQFAPTAVPEPASLATAGAGLLGVMGLVLRRRIGGR